MEIGKVYGFMYQGVSDHKPEFRRVLVDEEIGGNAPAIVGKLMEEENFEAIRRFRFDRMTSPPVNITDGWIIRR